MIICLKDKKKYTITRKEIKFSILIYNYKYNLLILLFFLKKGLIDIKNKDKSCP